jgi:hypothetical protein
VGMDLTDNDRLRAAKAAKDGTPAPDGPIINSFNSLQLAQAIEHEANRCAVSGFTKISLHMDVADAVKLASALRKLAFLGY